MAITSVQSRQVLTSPDEFACPGNFSPIPDEERTRQPVDQFGLNYDDVGNPGTTACAAAAATSARTGTHRPFGPYPAG